jgi:hypothetical protein
MTTIGKLAEMTDQAAFERLATAILLEAEPQYASLLHPGVNEEGKTVKSPVDGIGFVREPIRPTWSWSTNDRLR